MPRRPRLRPLLIGTLVLAGCGDSNSSSPSSAASSPPATTTSGSPAALGYEGVPLEPGADLAPQSSNQTSTTDGISCAAKEQLIYHIHAHLAVFVNGTPWALPAGIGIPGSTPELTTERPIAAGVRCVYWLHTHTSDGVIHVESPKVRIYTLGNFFDEWHQPLSASQVGSATGKITAFVNGEPWNKDLRSIPLVPRAVIQLSVGTPVVPSGRSHSSARACSHRLITPPVRALGADVAGARSRSWRRPAGRTRWP